MERDPKGDPQGESEVQSRRSIPSQVFSVFLTPSGYLSCILGDLMMTSLEKRQPESHWSRMGEFLEICRICFHHPLNKMNSSINLSHLSTFNLYFQSKLYNASYCKAVKGGPKGGGYRGLKPLIFSMKIKIEIVL